ncbi:MAG TPA: PQQ-binding-like beta-propeller repeat protein [Solirubrobacteraceae bacterium]|nr:PQQ-binding-like beta-propeller repeat protein [Solirubrobacteraceae bacterium]
MSPSPHRRSGRRVRRARRQHRREQGPSRRLIPRARAARAAIVAVVLLLAGAALAGYVYERNRTGNIYHPHARFIPQAAPKLPPTGPDRFAWPLYGYSVEHTRFYPAPATVRPPFREEWVHNEHALLEFPPVIYGNSIFQLADDGVLSAINKRTGRTFWARQLGTLSAASPAVNAATVYATVLGTGSSSKPGRVWALNFRNGHTRWYRDLSSPSESSPLLDGERVFFGSQSGLVYALNARSGAVIWTYQASGSVKASPTLAGGALYFGDYSGHVQAVSAQTGRRIWRSGSEGALFGSGTFYSTPAVIYGRVYLGNTDGRVYAYDAYSGRLDWAMQTGDYVYSSPAVTNAPGLGPTVFVGSYSGTFYAINARSGHLSWSFNAHGRISGSPTVIGRIVYFADLGEHRTYGLDISTGRVYYEVEKGVFDPVVSDSERLYLTGYTALYGLAPTDLSP